MAEQPLIVSIIGTRPEAIKMLPVVRALAARGSLSQQVVLTGQHAGLAAMVADAAQVWELPYDPAGRSAVKLRETLHQALCGTFRGRPVDLALVHGDTTSALAAAFAAHDCGIPIGHVEAGLRSFDYQRPWPEEGNRVAIDALSTLLFAPTEAAARNLASDPRVGGAVYVTGNSGIDALFEAVRQLPPTIDAACERKTILVTCHRKENQGAVFLDIAEALKRLVRELPVKLVLPLHVNRHIRRHTAALLGDTPGITLMAAVGHADMVALLSRSWLILTDSGGLQEEGAALGKPVIVLRTVTERPEAGPNIELVGADPERIFDAVAKLLREPDRYHSRARRNLAFGDGRAAPRIAAACEAFLQRRRPRLRKRS